MSKQRDPLIGELLLKTKDGNRALVYVYCGKRTFTLRRIDGIDTKEVTNNDPYNGDLNSYVSEAIRAWNDLIADGVEIKPKF